MKNEKGMVLISIYVAITILVTLLATITQMYQSYLFGNREVTYQNAIEKEEEMADEIEEYMKEIVNEI